MSKSQWRKIFHMFLSTFKQKDWNQSFSTFTKKLKGAPRKKIDALCVQVTMEKTCHLNSYFRLYVCLSFRPYENSEDEYDAPIK